MARQEFPAKVKVSAWKRCGGLCEAILPDGKRCGAVLTIGKFRYDHRIPDQLGGKPTLENCVVQCLVCDAPKTAADQSDIARAKRREVAHVGARPAPKREIKSPGFPRSQRTLDRKGREQLPLPPRRDQRACRRFSEA